jgi:hypothetical protein
MSQAVSHQPLTAEARVRGRVNPCGICGGQSETGTGLSPSPLALPCQYHATVAVHTHMSSGGMNNRPVGGRSSETCSYTSDLNNISSRSTD